MLPVLTSGWVVCEGRAGGRSFHLEHIKKQTHHPRSIGKPGSARGRSQADSICQEPRHPTDPVTSGCSWLVGSSSRDGVPGAVGAHHSQCCRQCVPPSPSILGAGCAHPAQRRGCWVSPTFTASPSLLWFSISGCWEDLPRPGWMVLVQ